METTIHEVLDKFHKRLYFEDDYDITIPVAYAISNFSQTDPGALVIVSPSGSYKTELIRSFGEKENFYVRPISSLTPHTFITGMKQVPDLAPQLAHRLITIKDFNAVLSKREEERVGILSSMRELLDGFMQADFGSGKKVAYSDIHSSFLIASTRAIERFYSLNSVLGQRLLFYRPVNDAKKSRSKANENMNVKTIMRKELKTAMSNLLNTVLYDGNNPNGSFDFEYNEYENPKEIKPKNKKLKNIGDNINIRVKEDLGEFCDLVARLRTHVPKDYKGNIDGIPEIEFGTRMSTEIIKIISCHAILYDRDVIGEDLLAGIKVLISNIPYERLVVLRHAIVKDSIEGITAPEVSMEINVSKDVAKKKLEELLSLGVFEKYIRAGRDGADLYAFNSDFEKESLIKLFKYDGKLLER